MVDILDDDMVEWVIKYIKYCRYGYETHENGIQKQANQICNSYLGVGIKFLQDVYDQFNIKQNEKIKLLM